MRADSLTFFIFKLIAEKQVQILLDLLTEHRCAVLIWYEFMFHFFHLIPGNGIQTEARPVLTLAFCPRR